MTVDEWVRVRCTVNGEAVDRDTEGAPVADIGALGTVRIGVDRHAAFLDGTAGMIEGLLAERVDAGGDEEDSLPAFDALHAGDRVGQGVI